MEMVDKKALRLALKARRQSISEEECSAASRALCAHILALPSFKKAQRVMFYLAMPKEANVDEAIQAALKLGKEVYVPVCMSATEMVAARLQSLEDVTTGVLRIRIPKEGYTTISPEKLEAVFVPGVCFDTKGGRLGMGAGYYDRFLVTVPRKLRLGIAWDWQVQEETLPMEPYDCYMGGVITDKQTLLF